MNEIESALHRKFERHRIVFWYDAKQELRPQFQELALEGVGKVEVANNEFGLKHRILREEPETRFLLYRAGPRPEDLDNWLLDVLLAHGEFRTDQVALWLAELELGLEFAELAEAHEGFLRNARFRAALKKRLKPDDTAGRIRMHMLGVCCGSDSRLDSVLEGLLHEMTSGKDASFTAVRSAGLEPFLWEQVKRVYGYQANEPGLRDFVIELFKSCYAMSTDGEVRLAADALVFLKRWKDSRKLEGSFEHFSAECAGFLDLEQDLAHRDVKDLVELDLFRMLDQKIIHDLVRAVSRKTMSVDDIRLMVRQRRQTHWYAEFADLYEAIEKAAQFLHLLEGTPLDFNTLEEGARLYRTQWYKLDQLYRKFTLHARRSKMTTLLGDLMEKVENGYDNRFLLKLNDRWQQLLDREEDWKVPGLISQRRFFQDRVSPYPGKDNKICLIISDAMRYEVGEELERRIKQEDRYSASLEAGLSVLPSYTQLGMAALLPHGEISIAEQGKGMVLVDGQSSQGTANRGKILAKAGFKSVAIKSDDILAMKREESRTLVREHEVFYVYHNRIDAVGHKLESEERAFEAVEEALDDLIDLLKKLNNANLYNFLLTSDHGFLYQNRALDESDYSASEAEGNEVWLRDRRFVVGKGLKPSKGLKSYSADQLGLSGEADVQISKSINRIRLKGAGSRFVHGGASLQEVVVPVLQVNKKRQNDVEYVEVEVLGGGGSVITSGQLAVNFYQAQPVSEKVQPRELRVGIYTKDGDLISDRHDLRFDLEAENPRSRELHVRFLLTRDAEKANHQEVILKLEEPDKGTSHYKLYKSARYTLRRSFTSDFDF